MQARSTTAWIIRSPRLATEKAARCDELLDESKTASKINMRKCRVNPDAKRMMLMLCWDVLLCALYNCVARLAAVKM